MTSRHPREALTENGLKIDQLADALAEAEARQARGVSQEERSRAGEEARDLRYQLDVHRAQHERYASEIPEAATPKQLRKALAHLDAEREKLTKAENPDPFAISAFDERTRVERETIAARLATAPTAAPTPDPAVEAAKAADRAHFATLQQTNAIAAASFAERRPWVHEQPPEAPKP